jgi:regulatory protein
MRRPGRKAELSELEMGDPKSSYAYAIALLSRRDYSSLELSRKLADRGFLEHAIVPVVEELLATNKVNNERYGQNVVAYRARRGQGPARIRQELKRSGLDRSAIDDAVKGDDAPDFVALASAVRTRKFGQKLPTDHKERARQARFLQYRGFSTDHIRAVLEGSPDDPALDPDGESDQS